MAFGIDLTRLWLRPEAVSETTKPWRASLFLDGHRPQPSARPGRCARADKVNGIIDHGACGQGVD